ncbi:MAG: diheme cytochrome c (N-terminal cytochrome b domain) [Ignavibacteria bacterium]|nr:diheme cytochrome c (N-terminal cytochrome b domain) [Ignavibacteria bacterium]
MKTYIWSLPTRIFHWLLVIGVIGALFTHEDEIINIHVAFGFMIFFLLIFRIIWGFIGPKYSKFKDFPVSIRKLKEEAKDFGIDEQRHAGHNPFASIIILLILIDTILTVLSGITLMSSHGYGISVLSMPDKIETIEEIHGTFAYTLVGLFCIHILGNIIDLLIHKKHTALWSIFTGNKNIEGESVKLKIGNKIQAIIFLLFAIFVFASNAIMQRIDTFQFKKNREALEKKEKVEEERHHDGKHD